MTCFYPERIRKGGAAAVRSVRDLDVPCGRCLGCKRSRARSWVVRLVHESLMSECRCHPNKRGLHNTFVTLTYSPQQLPLDRSLDVTHFQKFCKKLRKRVGPFRFFHCGEYGEQSLRPHYHALLFGVDFLKDSVLLEGRKDLYTSETLASAWTDKDGNPRGMVSCGSVTPRSASYVASYCVKKLDSEESLERFEPRTGEVWEVKKPYVTMSRRPGIGARWFERFGDEVYASDEVRVEGSVYRVPRYYDSLLERASPGVFEGVRAARRERLARNERAYSPSSLAAKASDANARFEMFSRRHREGAVS